MAPSEPTQSTGSRRKTGALTFPAHYERLSTQDSSFVMFEHRTTHMHLAAIAELEVGPLRTEAGGLDAGRNLAQPLDRDRPLWEMWIIEGLEDDRFARTAVMRYDGRVCWGIVADRDVVPDLGDLADDVDGALTELREAAGNPAP